MRDDVRVLKAMIAHWDPASGGVAQWGQSNVGHLAST